MIGGIATFLLTDIEGSTPVGPELMKWAGRAAHEECEPSGAR